MFCIYCGRPLEGQSAFCANCGASVTDMGGTASSSAGAQPENAAPDKPLPAEDMFAQQTSMSSNTEAMPMQQAFIPPPVAETAPLSQNFVPPPLILPGMLPAQPMLIPPPPPPFMEQPSAVPFMPMAEDFSSAKIITDAAAAAIAALPPVQMVEPADSKAEENYSIFKGRLKVGKDDIEGCLWITNKRFVFFENTESEIPSRDNILEILKNDNNLVIPTRMIHSIVWETVVFDCKVVAFYTYDELKYRIELTGKAFLAEFGKAIPGITIVNKKTLYDYFANMSESDPRNPNGTRYNPRYPRGYDVAEPYEWRKNPEAMERVINIAKRDGSLPMEWNKKITSTCLPPGVPCLVHSMF